MTLLRIFRVSKSVISFCIVEYKFLKWQKGIRFYQKSTLERKDFIVYLFLRFFSSRRVFFILFGQALYT